MKFVYLAKLLLLALLLELISLVIAYWVGIRSERVSMMIMSLFGIYVLFEFLFEFLQRQKRTGYLIKYFIYSTVRIFFILIIAYLLLKPGSIENRHEALFFLFNYLVFLIYDIAHKVNLINKNTN